MLITDSSQTKSAKLNFIGELHIKIGDPSPTETSLFYSPLKEVGVFSDEIKIALDMRMAIIC